MVVELMEGMTQNVLLQRGKAFNNCVQPVI
jgi:hypothetical protein